jgi:predicted O-linked N-acetylglucosamine transferase (SPINDLY family)
VERRFNVAIRRGQREVLDRPRLTRQSPTTRIKVGYLSADFHEHATAYLIAELIEKHDRQRFAVLGYSYGPDDSSPMRKRLVRAFDRFADLRNTSFVEASRRIAADGVDILVDLKGHTWRARTEIMALRPAAIQVGYLGYPGTMAAPFIDYALVDDFVAPRDQEPFYSEKLVYLPGCYQVNDSTREIAARLPTRSECGLPEKGFVFCCFNNNYKITPQMFDVWMRLLLATPESVLWLLAANPVAVANLQNEAEQRGVSRRRLLFAPRCPLPEHLARHRLADLFLDTFPYNAHTTASDALWAGCPLVTIAGETFASRVAGSLLRTIGLPELITTNLHDYEQLALGLAREEKLLADLRGKLQTQRLASGLFDGTRFARRVEHAFEEMYRNYAAGREPSTFVMHS